MLLSPLRAALRSSSAVTPATLTSSFPSAVASFRSLASASPSADQSSTRQTTSIPPPSMEDAIRTKLVDLLQPTLLEVRNDSSKHAHHRPMKEPGAYTGETHFAIYARSDVFVAKSRIARHRLVNEALKDEFARGLHALSLKLETEEEGAGK